MNARPGMRSLALLDALLHRGLVALPVALLHRGLDALLHRGLVALPVALL